MNKPKLYIVIDKNNPLNWMLIMAHNMAKANKRFKDQVGNSRRYDVNITVERNIVLDTANTMHLHEDYTEVIVDKFPIK